MDKETLVALGPFAFAIALIGGTLGIIYYFYDKKRHPEAY